jgi:trehalose 6-phosphate phosphatase
MMDVCGGALAIVSGRSIADLDRYLTPLRLPAVGLHGIEVRPTSRAEVRPSMQTPVLLQDAKAAAAALQATYAGLEIEDKGQSLALHYRRAPEAERDARQCLQGIVAGSGGALALLDGKMVLEVKPVGISKGDGLRTMLEVPPFAGRRPCFLGDDVTDESGFEVCNEKGGVSVHIGDGDTPTAAHYGLRDPKAVQAWLGQAVGTLESSAS